MNTNVSLETIRETLQDHVHVDAVRVRPGVLETQPGLVIIVDFSKAKNVYVDFMTLKSMLIALGNERQNVH